MRSLSAFVLLASLLGAFAVPVPDVSSLSTRDAGDGTGMIPDHRPHHHHRGDPLKHGKTNESNTAMREAELLDRREPRERRGRSGGSGLRHSGLRHSSDFSSPADSSSEELSNRGLRTEAELLYRREPRRHGHGRGHGGLRHRKDFSASPDSSATSQSATSQSASSQAPEVPSDSTNSSPAPREDSEELFNRGFKARVKETYQNFKGVVSRTWNKATHHSEGGDDQQ